MNDIFLSARGTKYQNEALARKNIPPGYTVMHDDEGWYGVKAQSKRVVCRYCGGSHYETTDQYNANHTAHPGMIRMVEPYRSYGWQEPPQDPTAGYGVLECCECGSPLAPEGYLTTRDQNG